ncbi:hypothetical protein DMZ48_14715 [Robertkochia solimangrovi]|nr:hypothetical protein DMZ48_14715 [Robertkochia solimangrovi]
MVFRLLTMVLRPLFLMFKKVTLKFLKINFIKINTAFNCIYLTLKFIESFKLLSNVTVQPFETTIEPEVIS